PALPSSTLSLSLFPYTTLFRSALGFPVQGACLRERVLSHDCDERVQLGVVGGDARKAGFCELDGGDCTGAHPSGGLGQSQRCEVDRKSTRLNSSHGSISYAVCF